MWWGLELLAVGDSGRQGDWLNWSYGGEGGRGDGETGRSWADAGGSGEERPPWPITTARTAVDASAE